MKKADKILHNGTIYISNAAEDYVNAIAVSGTDIICVGKKDECEAYADQTTQWIDLEGRMALPALIDGHVHPEPIAKSRWRVQMPELEDMHELLAFVKKYCEEHSVSEVPYFFGECYPTTMFDENGPRKEWLDEYVSDRPVRLQDFTDHACWYNSKALELMGINKENAKQSKIPIFVVDESGEPTGWVKEPVPGGTFENAMFEKIGWWPPTDVTEETLTPFLDMLKDWGVLALLDGFTENETAMKLFYDLDKAGKLHMYYEGSCKFKDREGLEDCIRTIKDWQSKYTSEHVRIHTAKFFIDGTNEMGNSASLEPHYNDPSGQNYGNINMSTEDLTAVLLRLNEEKIDLHIHVVGDRGFRVACDAYENALAEAERKGDAWNIYMELAHCELVHPDDMKRPAKLGIIINWSCHWAGGYFGEGAIPYFGRERWDTMYDMTTMIESGAIVTYGSDTVAMCEEHRSNPFFGMQISATRVDPEEPLDPEIYPGSVRPPLSARLSVKEMIRGYTRYGAIPLRLEDKIGTLEPGKKANLIVLDQFLFEISINQLHTVKTNFVMFEGEIIKNEITS